MKLWRVPFDHDPSATSLGQVHIARERCKGCGFCVEFCPCGVLELGPELTSKGYKLVAVKDASKCLACGFCEIVCPEFALKLSTNNRITVQNK